MRPTFSLVFFLLLNSGLLSAQQLTKVSASGSALISGDVSPNQAKAQALNDAKIAALQKAGITEHITSYQMLYTSQAKNDYNQLFNSDIISEMQGAVKSYEVKSEKTYCKSELEIVCEVNIDATVIKYNTKADPGFDIAVDGIKAFYSNDDKLTFSMKATKAGYLTIFDISDSDVSVLYPNPYEKQIQCKGNELYNFPFSKVNYTLHTSLSKPETNRLLVVFTKSEIPYINVNKDQLTTKENIFSWLYSIMPDQRTVKYMSFIIQN